MKIAALIVMALFAASCAHRGDLKSPSQIEAKKQKEAAKAEKEAARKAKAAAEKENK